LLYAGLSALVVRALTRGWRMPIRFGLVLAAAAIATAYGISDEIHQHFVPPRQADVFDVAADAAGAALAAVGLYGWDIIRGRHVL
jgi:VanZ family protein